MRNLILSKKDVFGGVHYTVNHTGKMTGLQSVSTSVLVNHNCEKRRANNDTICSHCFAAAMMKRYTSMQKAFIRNTEVLTSRLLSDNEIPVITARLFRFESFGDLVNAIQVANYFKIARLNPDTPCALWTKNPWLIEEAISMGYEKPANLNIVLSSTMLNKATSTKYNFIDKIFTVYDPATIEAENVEINCGARSCMTCQRCYKPNQVPGVIEYVNEKLK